jgi:uncharacterized membrane protein YhhN
MFCYLTTNKAENSKNKAVFWMGVTAIIMYLIVIIALLLPNLGDLTIPVFIYALVSLQCYCLLLKAF